MRFIVDVYRVVILAAIAIALIVGSFVIFTIVLRPDADQELGVLAVAGLIAGAVWMVLAIGLIATFVSMHDRLVVIADQARRIADVLESSAGHLHHGE